MSKSGRICVVSLLLIIILIIVLIPVFAADSLEHKNKVTDTNIKNTKTISVDTIDKKTKVENTPKYIYVDVPLSNDLQEHIQDECIKYNVEYELILAMIELESNFTVDCISYTNDHGLMQIHNRPDLLDPYLNTSFGIKLIGELIAKYENYNDALMCYNCGEYGASQLWESGIYSTEYSRIIMEKYDYYKSIIM